MRETIAKRNFIAKAPETMAIIKPAINGANSILTDPLDKSINDLTPAAPIAGTLSRNDQRAAVLRLIPENRPAVIVIPDLDVPGTKARI